MLIGVFALPLGLGNAVSQPLAFLLLLPILTLARGAGRKVWPAFFYVVLISLFQTIQQTAREFSFYQFVRSGTPLLFLCILLVGYRNTRASLAEIVNSPRFGGLKALDRLMYMFAFGQLTQTILFKLHIPLANALSYGDGVNRLLLFPALSSVFLLYYGMCSNKVLLTSLAGVTLLSTGSKGLLIAAVAVILVSFLRRSNLASVLRKAVALTVLGAFAIYGNFLAIERMGHFVFAKNATDVTRDYEIDNAREAFLRSGDTILTGNGLLITISRGVASIDDRWAENSKYDIENAYWALLAKLGIIGCAWIVAAFASLPRSHITLAVVLVECIIAFKGSWLFFVSFDGSYLLIWSMLVAIALGESQ